MKIKNKLKKMMFLGVTTAFAALTISTSVTNIAKVDVNTQTTKDISNNNSISNISNSTPTLDVNAVRDAFRYEANQTIVYSFDSNVGPTITISENIDFRKVNASFDWTDFKGIELSLSGEDNSYLSGAKFPLPFNGQNPWTVDTKVTWKASYLTLEELNAANLGYLDNQNEKIVAVNNLTSTYTEQSWTDKNNVKKDVNQWTGGVWGSVKDKLPRPHKNNFVNREISFEELTNQDQSTANKSLFKESFNNRVDTNRYFLSDETTMTTRRNSVGMTREEYTYNNRYYGDWLNRNFSGWGDCNTLNCSMSTNGWGTSVLNYEMKLIGQDGYAYEMTKGLQWDTNKVVDLDIAISDLKAESTGENEVKITFEISHGFNVSGALDLRNYGFLMIKIEEDLPPAPSHPLPPIPLPPSPEHPGPLSSTTNWIPWIDQNTVLKFGINEKRIVFDTSKKFYVNLMDENRPTSPVVKSEVFNKPYVPVGTNNDVLWGTLYWVGLSIVIAMGAWLLMEILDLMFIKKSRYKRFLRDKRHNWFDKIWLSLLFTLGVLSIVGMLSWSIKHLVERHKHHKQIRST